MIFNYRRRLARVTAWCARGRRGSVWLAAAAMTCVLLSATGHGQQDGIPQTGGPRTFWPQRPGPAQVLVIPAVPPPPPTQAQSPERPNFVPNQVLVQFLPGVTELARAAARDAVGTVEGRTLTPGDARLEVLTTSLPVPDAIAVLQALPGVEFAEPNWIVRHAATSDDPRFTDGSMFGMYGDSSTPANQFGSQAAEAWARGFTGSSDVYVAVIDEGIDLNHPDLAPNIWTNPFDPVDGVDNDGNGRIDDAHGWDFLNEDNSIYDGSPADTELDRHGTHVAGTIGARGGNGIGVAGVNWNVTLIGAKFLGPDEGTTGDAIEAIEYLTDLKTRHGLNLVALNSSWGGGDYSLALHQAIIRAAKQDILFIAAAGNGGDDSIGDNNDSVPHYPANYATNVAAGLESAASYDAVVAVASLTSAGALSPFSNFGATSVDIGAPGSGIVSTTPQNGYLSMSGTSMATPHVTGAVALYKAINPDASAAQIRSVILDHGLATAALAGKTVTGDRLNVGDFTTAVDMTISDARVGEGQSGTRTATFTVALSASAPLPLSVNYTTTDATATSAANTAAIAIPDFGSASPFPSTIVVPAGFGTITSLQVRLNNFGHTFPSDVDVLLVGPAGQSVVLMSDVGGGGDVSNLSFTFDEAGVTMPTSDTLQSGTYRPTNSGTGDSFSSPAPTGPYGATLAAFNGTSPVGTWKLFIQDDSGSDSGSVAGGWQLVLPTTSLVDYVSSSGTLTIPAGSTSETLAVTVNGDTTVESSETFTVTLFDSGANITDGEGLGTIVNDDFTDGSLTGVPIKAVHVLELRAAINDARAANGLGAFGFADVLTAQSTSIKAVHISELRTALAQAYAAAGEDAPVYTDPALIPGVTPARAAHILELRAAVAALE